MSWEIYFVLALLLFAIASFIWERIPPDLTSITVFGVLLFTAMLSESSELPSLRVLLDVFSNPAPITLPVCLLSVPHWSARERLT